MSRPPICKAHWHIGNFRRCRFSTDSRRVSIRGEADAGSVAVRHSRTIVMDENKIAGSAKQAGGKAISDAKLQSDGDDD